MRSRVRVERTGEGHPVVDTETAREGVGLSCGLASGEVDPRRPREDDVDARRVRQDPHQLVEAVRRAGQPEGQHAEPTLFAGGAGAARSVELGVDAHGDGHDR